MGTLGLIAGIAGVLGLVIGGGLKQVNLKKGSAEGGGTPSKVLMGTGGALLVVGIVLVVVGAQVGATTPAAASPTSAGAPVAVATTVAASGGTSTAATGPAVSGLGPVSTTPAIAWGPRTVTFGSPGQSCQLVRADMDVPIINGDNMDHHDLEWAPWCDDGGFQLDASGKSLNRSSQKVKPDPVTCAQDAQSGSLPNTYGGDLHVGDTFCLLTGGGHVVWLQLTAKTGDPDGPTLVFNAIAWTAP